MFETFLANTPKQTKGIRELPINGCRFYPSKRQWNKETVSHRLCAEANHVVGVLQLILEIVVVVISIRQSRQFTCCGNRLNSSRFFAHWFLDGYVVMLSADSMMNFKPTAFVMTLYFLASIIVPFQENGNPQMLRYKMF